MRRLATIDDEPGFIFRMGDAFPAHDPISRWIVNMSIAYNDLRVAGKYLGRAEQPVSERIYFLRILVSHLREILKLIVLDPRERCDVREFVARLPQQAQDARGAVERAESTAAYVLRPGISLYEEVKRIRDDTFHYARDSPSDQRLRAALESVADMEGLYLRDHEQARADYADLVIVNRMHPSDATDAPEAVTADMRELHEAMLSLSGEILTFIRSARAAYLCGRPAGTLKREA